MAADVPLAETFIETDWSRYSVANPNTSATQIGRKPSPDGVTYPWGLSTLNHVDVRTFNKIPVINTTIPLDTPENWVLSGNATVTSGPNSSFNHWRMLGVTFNAVAPVSLTSIAQTLDLTQVGTNAIMQFGYISTAVNTATTYLDLSTDGFVSEIASVPFSASALLSSNIFWVPLSEWDSIDLTQVNGVRLRFGVTSTSTLVMSGIRVVDPAYEPSSIMFDNWNGILRQDIPFNANTSAVPVASNQQMPPVTYVASTGGSDDPQPINATFGMVINTGGNTGTNTVSINMRQVGGIDTSQLLLEGQTMLELSNGPQPGLTQTAEIARRMSDFQGLPLSDFQGESMLDMDAVAENVTATWVTFQFTWGSSNSVYIAPSVETDANPYQWSDLPTLTSFTNYLVTCALTDNTVQMQIWSLNQTTLAQEILIFDTTEITDSYQFVRRPGRIGWAANFTDGEAHVTFIRPERTMFAEYQSVPINSRTPVQATQLYATYASDLQTWTSFTPATIAPNGRPVTAPIVSADTTRTITGSSTKVYVNQSMADQGVISNVLSLDDISGVMDWTEVEINLSVWFPSSSAIEGPLAAYLVSETGWYIPLSFPQINYDTWQSVTFDGPDIPSGLYQLQIVYTGTQQTTFWIDAVSVAERALTWDARANGNDPWTPFNGLVNSTTSSVQVNRGTSLQIRAQARRQDAAISSKPKIVPSFAQLGRAVWPEDVAANLDPFIQPLGYLSSALTSATHYTSIPVQALTATQAAGVLSFTFSGRSLLTITAPNGAQSTFFNQTVSPVAGTTSLTATNFETTITLPTGSVITGLGAPIWNSLVSGRQYQFSAAAQSSVGASDAYPYYDPVFIAYIVSWLWQFSDGTILSGPNVSHTFAANAVSGTPYDITLTTMDVYGNYSTNTITIEVA